MFKSINITINNKKYTANNGQTILAVCQANGIDIPTLCKHPDLAIQGKCRVCLVEVEGQGIVTACTQTIADDIKVKTNTPLVKRARAVNLEMIYAEHIEKCSACIQEHSCALKDYARQYGLKITRYQDRKAKLPTWRFGNFIQFDSSKCIDCGICTEVCRDQQTCDFYQTVNKGYQTQTKPTDQQNKDCAYCGQCVVHCPVGAVQGVPHWQFVEELIKNKKTSGKTLVAQIAPSIRVSIGEEYNLAYGQITTGQLAASMRVLGFDAVFDVSAGADFTSYEEARELIHWLEAKKDRPMFTACCPAWVKFIAFYYPEFISHLTTTRSPHIHSAIIAKTYWAELMGKKPQDVMVVSIMPCTAKKQEISLITQRYQRLPIVDYVVTTREYAYLLRRAKIDFPKLESKELDNPLGNPSGAGIIYGASGGVMESALRSADYMLRVKKETGSLKPIINGENYQLTKNKYSPVSQGRIEFKQVRGQQGIKEAVVNIGGKNLRVAVVSGLGNARKLIENIKAKKCQYDYVEVMACPGGCIGGGGQPVPVSAEIRAQRAAALYNLDQNLAMRAAHENESLLAVYRDYFKGRQKLIEQLMHCQYNVASRTGYVKKF
ncbi:2Fe-2S iron-sulfur cluster binding domain-containing protein [Candidatus Kuenenbacteria bacterium]|uniref:Ferredoxin n=1 Tax=Candidatus Kuenenbacteria bacterium CG2_30_39_24 TaxID=1805236 RepID=A0A1J5FFS6_9BACT|nr:2Fe-2S iron-sulfur cluster binding domain-containing protein [Candidatus Kuenenbacteria bacterium]OIP56346.1 MAG: hypothetical protein AUK13_01320 [Candidatus Kuenenbacteria bacterium CG2_30_39_24]